MFSAFFIFFSLIKSEGRHDHVQHATIIINQYGYLLGVKYSPLALVNFNLSNPKEIRISCTQTTATLVTIGETRN